MFKKETLYMLYTLLNPSKEYCISKNDRTKKYFKKSMDYQF